jgi:hypothetical protein
MLHLIEVEQRAVGSGAGQALSQLQYVGQFLLLLAFLVGERPPYLDELIAIEPHLLDRVLGRRR